MLSLFFAFLFFIENIQLSLNSSEINNPLNKYLYITEEIVSIKSKKILIENNYKNKSQNTNYRINEIKSKSILLNELKTNKFSIGNKYPKSVKEKIDILKLITNNEFQNVKNDMFGETRQTFLFYENGKGKASWSWTVNSRIEEGSSDLTWQLINDKIIIKYKYHSKTSETSNEKITLIFSNKNASCLININDKNEKYCKL